MYEAAKLFFVEKVSSVWDTTTKALCWIKEGGAGGEFTCEFCTFMLTVRALLLPLSRYQTVSEMT